MRLRTVAVTSLVAVAAAGALTPALAAPKVVTHTYEVGPLTPDPTPIALGEICAPATPTAIHGEPFKIPAAGRLKVDIEFIGDWALGLRDAKGKRLAESDGASPETPESMSVKFKKGGEEVLVESCNFAGAPNATVTLTFTYA